MLVSALLADWLSPGTECCGTGQLLGADRAMVVHVPSELTRGVLYVSGCTIPLSHKSKNGVLTMGLPLNVALTAEQMNPGWIGMQMALDLPAPGCRWGPGGPSPN